MRGQMRAVDDILGEIGASGYPTITVFNKQDLLEEETRNNLRKQYPEAVLVSAKTSEGLHDLIKEIDKRASAYFSSSREERRFLDKS
jgi:GTP-binding protein HflX